MASSKLFPAKTAKDHTYIKIVNSEMNDIYGNHDHNLFEFDEADIWHNNSYNSTTPEVKKIAVPAGFRSAKKGGGKLLVERKTPPPVTCAAASLPVNIPDWSKIYRGSLGDHDQESDDDEDSRVPPHVYLARRRGASFSVHEGIGRTLKGRDLRQVRNAIWKKVGFED